MSRDTIFLELDFPLQMLEFLFLLCMGTVVVQVNTDCESNGNCLQCGVQSSSCVKCRAGFVGPRCERRCSPNCKYDACIFLPSSGIDECLYGCKLGYYGRRCSAPCSRPGLGCAKCEGGCKSGYCMDKRSCISGCRDSYYGSNCSRCSPTCKVCNLVNGDCQECLPYYGGSNCTVVCRNCLGPCHRECIGGCLLGFHGKFCNDVCEVNCIGGCNQGTGTCNGCQDGWYGAYCKSKCNFGCAQKSCTTDGNCIYGCKDGYLGPNCNVSCIETCTNGNCNEGTMRNCFEFCSSCHRFCQDELINCNETCKYAMRSRLCDGKSKQTKSRIDLTITTETIEEKKGSFTIYLAVSVIVLGIMMAALLVYFLCSFQRFRRIMYDSVHLVLAHVTRPAEPVNELASCDEHEYDEVDEVDDTIAATSVPTSGPPFPEVLSSSVAAVNEARSLPQVVNHSELHYVNTGEGYLTPRMEPDVEYD